MNPDPLYKDYMYDRSLESWYDECIKDFQSAMRDSIKKYDHDSFIDLCDSVATCAYNYGEAGAFMKYHDLNEAHALCWLFHRYHNVYSWNKVIEAFDKIQESEIASCF